MKFLFLYSIVFILYYWAFKKNRVKAVLSIKRAIRGFVIFIPYFLQIILLTAITLNFIPDSLIIEYLGSANMFKNAFFAGAVGSMIFIPAFIAFPIAAILLKKGITYFVIAIFTTTMMMVGTITFPVEKKYFGLKFTIYRNFAGLIISIIIAVIIGFFYNEF